VTDVVSAEAQQRIEQFLYREAALLDAWRLEEWLALYADDASYVIPATTSDAGREVALSLISDDRARLAGRVKRLLSTHAHANNPRPRTRHIVANVKGQLGDDGAMTVYANFVIYSMRNRQTNLYMGEYRYRLRSVSGGGFLIEEKRAILDMETLDPAGGKINIVI
jgi:p-cumate 2,3-dioxygenase beta subunit